MAAMTWNLFLFESSFPVSEYTSQVWLGLKLS